MHCMESYQSGNIVGQLRNFDHYLIDAGDFIIINVDPNLSPNEIEYTLKSCERCVSSLSFYWNVDVFY